MAGAPTARDQLSTDTRRPGPALRGPAFVVFVGLLLAACGGETEPQTLTLADSGTTVRLAPQETIEVRLESNATTGYEWHVLGDELDTDVVEVVSSEYVPDETEEPIAGSGGTEVWRFRALARGRATVGMTYYFGDEPDRTGKEFTFTIVVE